MGKRIAIVGAGPSGLARLRAFPADAEAGGDDAAEIVRFEKQAGRGGLGEPIAAIDCPDVDVGGANEAFYMSRRETVDDSMGSRPVDDG